MESRGYQDRRNVDKLGRPVIKEPHSILIRSFLHLLIQNLGEPIGPFTH